MPVIEWTEVIDPTRPRGREFAGWIGVDQEGRGYIIAGHVDGSGLWQITLPDGTQSPGILGGGSVRQSAEEWATSAGRRELPDRGRIPLAGLETSTNESSLSAEPRASHESQLSRIRNLVAERDRIDRLIDEAVQIERSKRPAPGWGYQPIVTSWAEIGAALGVSGQAAGQKYGGKR